MSLSSLRGLSKFMSPRHIGFQGSPAVCIGVTGPMLSCTVCLPDAPTLSSETGYSNKKGSREIDKRLHEGSAGIIAVPRCR